MEDKKAFFLNYIKAGGKIISVDLVRIQQSEGIGIAEQMKILKSLAADGWIEDKTDSWWEPLFLCAEPIDSQIAKAIQGEGDQKGKDAEKAVLRYIGDNEGEFDEIDLFIDFGIPSDIQKKHIDLLLKRGAVERFKDGFRLKRAETPSG